MVNFFLGFLFLGFCVLLYSAYVDLKTTYVPEGVLIPVTALLAFVYFLRHGIWDLAVVLALGHLLYLMGFWASGDSFLFWLSVFVSDVGLNQIVLYLGVLALSIFLFTYFYIILKNIRYKALIFCLLFTLAATYFVKASILLHIFLVAILLFKEYGRVVEIKASELTADYWLERPLKLPNGRIIPAGRPITEEEAEEIRKYFKKIKVREGVPIGGGFPLAVVVWWILTSSLQLKSCLLGL